MRTLWISSILLILGSTACYRGLDEDIGAGADEGGDAGEEPLDGAQALACDPALEVFAPPRVWRLTRRQYDATVADLLGDKSKLATQFQPESITHFGFSNDSDALRIGSVEVFELERAAQTLAKATSLQRLHLVFPCASTELNDPACVQQFLEEFGRRTFRRPLEPAEVEAYRALYQQGVSLGSASSAGVRAVIEAMLQSPHFLYRSELGDGQVDSQGRVRLAPYELASALAYTLIGTTPDDELLDAAEAGLLATREQVEAQARRLIESPRGREGMVEFYRQLFGFASLERAEKIPERFPSFPQAKPAMFEELDRFVAHVLFEDDARWETLLTAPYTFLNGALADVYGVPAPAQDWSEVDISGVGRSGILTMPGVMAAMAYPEEISIAKRGLMVRTRLLCQMIPDPPPDAFNDVPAPVDGQTERDQLEGATEGDGCQGCHALFNPLGFAFDSFDAMGSLRTFEGKPYNLSGEMVGTRDIDGAFDGPQELAQLLAVSEQAGECLATQHFRFSLGRDVTRADACSVVSAYEVFVDSGGDLIELAVATVSSDAFLYRQQD